MFLKHMNDVINIMRTSQPKPKRKIVVLLTFQFHPNFRCVLAGTCVMCTNVPS